MSDAERFTESQLKKLGFSECPETGVWSKEGIRADNPESSSSVLESNSGGRSKEKHGNEEETKRPVRQSHEEGTRYTLVIHTHRTRFIDFSNAAIKWIEDRLTHWGIIPDDCPKYCDQPIVLLHKAKQGEEKTVIELYSYKL